MGRYVTNAITHEVIPLVDTPRWQPRSIGAHTWRWDFAIDQHRNGLHIGCISTDIAVYPSGKMLWPGRPAMQFGSAEEAMRYAEATWVLEGGE